MTATHATPATAPAVAALPAFVTPYYPVATAAGPVDRTDVESPVTITVVQYGQVLATATVSAPAARRDLLSVMDAGFTVSIRPSTIVVADAATHRLPTIALQSPAATSTVIYRDATPEEAHAYLSAKLAPATRGQALLRRIAAAHAAGVAE